MKKYKWTYELTKEVWNNLLAAFAEDEKEYKRHWEHEVKKEYDDFVYVGIKCTREDHFILEKLIVDAQHWGEKFEPCCDDCPFNAKKFSDCGICCYDSYAQVKWSQSRRGIRSATGGDYGPNARWSAPGMSVRDFI